jgi:hypothetical protein
MNDRGFAIAHGFLAAINVGVVAICAALVVKAVHSSDAGLFFLDAAVLVSNLYLAYLNVQEIKKYL